VASFFGVFLGMSAVNIRQITEYLKSYLAAYRNEYNAFVSPAPSGGGYPSLCVSPYLDTSCVDCFVGRDGCAIADLSKEPNYRWEFAGGPGFISDQPISQVSSEVVESMRAHGINSAPIGLHRVVSKNQIPENVWKGDLGQVAESEEASSGDTLIQVKRYDASLKLRKIRS
jgi:hypothetical protein